MKCILADEFEFEITNIIESNEVTIGKTLRITSLDRSVSLSTLESKINQTSTSEIKVINDDAGVVITYYGYTTVSGISFKNNRYEVGYDINLLRPINYTGRKDTLIEEIK